MPQTYAADLSSMAQAAQTTAQHGVAAAKHGKTEPAICPTDDENKVLSKPTAFSLDYAWRSGVAGGVAGCTVSRISPNTQQSPATEFTAARFDCCVIR